MGWLRRQTRARRRGEPVNFLITVLLPRPCRLDPAAVDHVYREAFRPRRLQIDPTDDSALSIDSDAGWSTARVMPAPPPPDATDEAVRRFLWPPAAPRPESAAAFMLVVGTGEVMRDAALAASRAAVALMETTDALGVYVDSARHLVGLELFGPLITDEVDDPTMAWVDVTVTDSPEGRSMRTTGLERFGHPELEIVGTSAPVGELRQAAWNYVRYLVDNDAALEHGQTIGGSADERFAVTREPSTWGDRPLVCRIHWP